MDHKTNLAIFVRLLNLKGAAFFKFKKEKQQVTNGNLINKNSD